LQLRELDVRAIRISDRDRRRRHGCTRRKHDQRE
jgi:hypothetical protein